MKYRSFITIALCGFLASCGTTYKPPTEPAPAGWQGKSGIALDGETYLTESGIIEEGQVFARIAAKNVRTARLVEDVTYTSGPGVTSVNKDVVLTAGTPFYARQFTQSVTTYSNYAPSSTRYQSADRNPIEWCAAQPNGKGSVCIFWQDPDTAFYAEDRSSSPVSPSSPGVGAKGPMPKFIEDENVTFSSILEVALVMARTKKKHVLIQQIAGSDFDGKFRGSVVNFQQKKWKDDGTVTLNMAGGEFILSKVYDGEKETDSINVQVVKPPQVTRLQGLSDADRAKLMELLLKATKKEN